MTEMIIKYLRCFFIGFYAKSALDNFDYLIFSSKMSTLRPSNPTSGKYMFNTKKGFSLVEVLVSLFLVSTVAFSMMQLQWQAKQWLSLFLFRVKATHYLDQAEEMLYLDEEPLLNIESPYQLSIEHKNKGIFLQMHWYNLSDSASRFIKKVETF